MSQPPTIGTPRRVLCIDDSEVILDRMKTTLEPHGYEVVTTSHTSAAARWLPGCGLVIIDFHMPGFDGAAVVASLRDALSKDEKSRMPFFYLYTSTSATTEYVKLGFDGVFTRKGDESALVPQVDAAFRRLRMRELAKKQS
jgi:two-component system, OmpR family, response regulator